MTLSATLFSRCSRETIVQRITDGARARAERGLATGGTPLLGLDKHPHKKCLFVVNEDEAVVTRLIFSKYLELANLSELRDFLNDAGYRTKVYVTKDGRQRGGLPWRRDLLHDLLTNGRLAGKVEVNKSKIDEPEAELHAYERYKVVDAAWPAIIDETTFLKVQEKLMANKKTARFHVHGYRLKDLVKCGLCGKNLAGQSANGIGGKYFYYGHSRKENAHSIRCNLERVVAVKLEELVIDRLTEMVRNPKLLVELAAKSQDSGKDSTKEIDQVITVQEQEKKKVDRMVENLVASLAERPEGIVPQSIYKKISELERQSQQIADSLGELREQRKQTQGRVLNADHIFRILRAFGKDFSKLPVMKQSKLIKSIVSEVTIYENSVRVSYYGSPKNPDVLSNPTDGFEDGFLIGVGGQGDRVDFEETARCRTLVRPVSGMVENKGNTA